MWHVSSFVKGARKAPLMKLYAARRTRALRQAACDVLTVAWVTAWVWLGVHVHRQVSASQDGARKIEKGGGALARSLHDAAGILAHTPLVGGKVRGPVDKSADAATTLRHAGGELADNLGRLGAAIGFEVALVPVLVAVLGWLVLRIGYARRAGRAVALTALPGGADLLALDALTRLPARRLAIVGDLPVERWRAGDAETIAALATAYLDHLGLDTAYLDHLGLDTCRPDDHGDPDTQPTAPNPLAERLTNTSTGPAKPTESAEIAEPVGDW